MTQQVTFDERARTLTQSLLTEAERVPSRLPRYSADARPWKAISLFAASVLVIGGAIVGASVALHRATASKPLTANHATWKSFAFPDGGAGTSISCPDVNECVAVDLNGHVYVSTHPGGGTAAWKVALIEPAAVKPPGKELTGISCPAPSLCVATDIVGNVVTSTNPGGGAAAWTLGRIDVQAALSGISCPDVNLCVAVGGLNQEPPPTALVFTSTDPAAGAASWTATDINGLADLTAISCPTATFCVATDGFGDVVTSTDPTGGAQAWHVSNMGLPVQITGIDCPSAQLCVAIYTQGGVVTSSDPTGGAGAWKSASLDASRFFISISCPSTTFCIAAPQSDSVFVTHDPTGGASAWTRQQVTAGGIEALGVSCPSTRLCVAVGAQVHVYTDPGG
ncbi:MAG: hypothetical protein WAW53_10010 [Candidatus Dormiibacterota bacterium]